MKKLFLTTIVLLVAVLASAQVKVVPKLQKGQKMTYIAEATTNAGMDITLTGETVYEVVDETADGFVISITCTKMDTQGGDETMRTIMTLTEQMMVGQSILVSTDKEGKVTGIKNATEAREACIASLTKIVDQLFEKNPSMAQVISKEQLRAQAVDAFTDEALLKSITAASNSPLALNGLTIRNMAQDTYTNAQDIKMKRMYFVTNGGKTITTNSTASMTEDEVKAFVIKQVEEKAPEQAETIKQNIDTLVGSGMMKIEANEKVKYDLGENGWVSSIDYTSTMSLMGQTINMKNIITLK